MLQRGDVLRAANRLHRFARFARFGVRKSGHGRNLCKIFFTAANLSRKQLFRLRKCRQGALNARIFVVIDQINACEKPVFHRCFCDVQNLRGRHARAKKNFSA
ncbi:MAG TPA: hypothetical protein VGG11_21155 [Xanthobacteraceae bacterium]|jgi:hypothetical protein